MTDPRKDPAASILAYHERTKHRFEGYAAGPGALDWAEQPAAFRDYGDCPRVELGWVGAAPAVAQLAAGRRPPPAPLDRDSLGGLFACSFAIATWKRYGADRWALRCNPSSGNLHPTEVYTVLPATAGWAAGLYHYRPQDHRLERRCAYPEAVDASVFGALPHASFLLGLAAVPWREAWKYGERAWRYCLLDQGHALAALRYAAALQGWAVTALEHLADADVAALLGLDRHDEFHADEAEYPELLCLVTPAATGVGDWQPPPDLGASLHRLSWCGRANRLSPLHHRRWPLVDASLRAAAKPATRRCAPAAAALPPPLPYPGSRGAVAVLRGRRSAQAMDEAGHMRREDFFALMDHCLPRDDLPPWGPGASAAAVHLIAFVHRVEGLAPGLYALPRRADALASLQQALRDEFEWGAVAGCPPHLPLRQLVIGDARASATALACRQQIAGGGAFSVAMLGAFAPSARSWDYRRRMAEAGMIGQVLYLGAEACGFQGTGIGCFFDDALHELFGLEDAHYQVLYQFTVGKARMDERISNEPAYPFLAESQGAGLV